MSDVTRIDCDGCPVRDGFGPADPDPPGCADCVVALLLLPPVSSEVAQPVRSAGSTPWAV